MNPERSSAIGGPEMSSRLKFAGALGILMLGLLVVMIYLSGPLPRVAAEGPDEFLELEGEGVIHYDLSNSEPLEALPAKSTWVKKWKESVNSPIGWSSPLEKLPKW